MKRLFISIFFISFFGTCYSQISSTKQNDSLAVSIKLIEKAIQWSTHGECYIEFVLTNNSCHTLYYIDDNNMDLPNIVTEKSNLWIARGCFVGGRIPIKKVLLPDSSFHKSIIVMGFDNNEEYFRIGFDLIKTTAKENILKKGKKLGKNTNVIWSNLLWRKLPHKE
jgi:hypothetical protein